MLIKDAFTHRNDFYYEITKQTNMNINRIQYTSLHCIDQHQQYENENLPNSVLWRIQLLLLHK